VLAGTYQPIQFGGESGGAFPGLPTGDFRSVNTYGYQTGQDYLPPQLGAFTVVESITNTGPEAVSIVAVSMEDPLQSAVGVPPWPLTPAGPVLGTLEQFTAAPVPVHKVAGFSLAPGQMIRIAIPVRLSGTCYDKGSWSVVTDFYVEERFLTFTHWVTVAMPIPLMFRQPASPGSEPVKDLTCLARH
jgi:hypothetical protein